MITTIQLKRGLEEDWEYRNPILKIGEPGYATDTKVLKIGDGVTAWNDLEPINAPAYDPNLQIVTIEEGSNIILDADSGNTYYRYKGTSPITVSVPNTIPLVVPLAINQIGDGEVTLQGASGVILSTANLTTGGQGFGVTIMKVADNLVDVIGGVAKVM